MSLVLPSVQAREGNRVTWQTHWWCSYVFAHKPRWRQLTPLKCDPVSLSLSLSHTHTHNAHNSAFEQSIANTLTNNKTYLQSLIQKRQIVIAKSELTLFFVWKSELTPALHSPRFTKLSSIKFVAQIRTFELYISTSWRRHAGACFNEAF